MRIKIKNWDEFQHYKDRNPPWIKLHRRLLNDRQFFNLDGDCVKTLVLLWMLAAETQTGDLPAIDDIAFRLRIDSSLLASQISKLSHWLIVDDSEMLADCKRDASDCVQDAPSETETETETEKETDGEPRACAINPKPNIKRKTVLPATWEPNDKHQILAVELGVDLDTQLEAFRDYEAANVRRMADWDACFRTWLKKAAEFAEAKNRQFPGRQQRKTPQQQSLDAIERWRNEDDDTGRDSGLSQDLGDRISRAVSVGRTDDSCLE